jgi:hypothetical protein
MNERDKTRLRDMLDAARKAIKFTQGRVRPDLDHDGRPSFMGLSVLSKSSGKPRAGFQPKRERSIRASPGKQ